MIYLGIWLFLIVAGIVAKRIYGRSQWMVLFHLPATVFLILGGFQLVREHRGPADRQPASVPSPITTPHGPNP